MVPSRWPVLAALALVLLCVFGSPFSPLASRASLRAEAPVHAGREEPPAAAVASAASAAAAAASAAAAAAATSLSPDVCLRGDAGGRFYGLDPSAAIAHADLFAVFESSPSPQRASRLAPVHPATQGVRAHSLPYISGDGFRQLADVVVEEFDFAGELRAALAAVAAGGSVASALAPGAAAVVFCAQHVRDDLLAAGLLDVAAVDIVLVAHNSDAEGPPLDAPWLRHARLRAVFAQNCAGETAAMRCLPIGLANRHWPHGAALATLTDAVRANAVAAAGGSAPAAPLVGHACFGDTHVERAPLRAVLAGLAWVSAACTRDPAAYYAGVASADAIISPRGNGVDAHRSWEALLLGRLVVTRHSSIDALWRAGGSDEAVVQAHAPALASAPWTLPVLLLDDWTALNATQTEAALCAARRVPPAQRATDHAFMPYWACEIGKAAGRAAEFCSTDALLRVLAKP